MYERRAMAHRGPEQRLTGRLVDTLYTEALLLSDEARAYFDDIGRAERDALPPLLRVGFSCESLKVTTRLMHIIAWLLTRRAVEAGELSPAVAAMPQRRLGGTIESDAAMVDALPPSARHLIAESRDLYTRVARLERGLDRPADVTSPARGLLLRLERAF